MKQILRQHKAFFGACLLFWVVGLIFLAVIEKGDAIQFFALRRTDFWNSFFSFFTHWGEEIAYFIIIGILLFVRFRASIFTVLVGIVVTIITFSAKKFFYHPRPATWYGEMGTFETIDLVPGIDVVTGHTSFPSGHTMSAFALYTFVALLARKRPIIQIACFIAAVLVGLSRIYLVQHFLQDIVVGSMFGVLIGILMYLGLTRLPNKPQTKWLDRSILWFWRKEHV